MHMHIILNTISFQLKCNILTCIFISSEILSSDSLVVTISFFSCNFSTAVHSASANCFGFYTFLQCSTIFIKIANFVNSKRAPFYSAQDKIFIILKIHLIWSNVNFLRNCVLMFILILKKAIHYWINYNFHWSFDLS